MRFHNLKYRFLAVLLAMSIFNFNLVILPLQAEEGCRCEHSHGENGFACFCGNSMEKPHCDTKGPALSRGHCGLDKKDTDFSIPANEFPSLLSSEGEDLRLHMATLKMADGGVFACADLLPIEHPPSVL